MRAMYQLIGVRVTGISFLYLHRWKSYALTKRTQNRSYPFIGRVFFIAIENPYARVASDWADIKNGNLEDHPIWAYCLINHVCMRKGAESPHSRLFPPVVT